MKNPLSNKHDNKDMQTQCMYISCVFSKIGKGTRYHVFLEDNLSYSFCGSGPANEKELKKMVRLGSICLNCHREIIREVIEKERKKNAESTGEL